jgi:hypothetical protein
LAVARKIDAADAAQVSEVVKIPLPRQSARKDGRIKANCARAAWFTERTAATIAPRFHSGLSGGPSVLRNPERIAFRGIGIRSIFL